MSNTTKPSADPEDRHYPLVYPPTPLLTPRDKKTRKRKTLDPFPLSRLPFELRLRIYFHALFPETLDHIIDLDPKNERTLLRRLALLRANHQIYAEASPEFYKHAVFRIFPLHPRFFQTDRILLARLPTSHRPLVQNLELRLGPGWGNPPHCWNIGGIAKGPNKSSLSIGALGDCRCVRFLKVFVECDPSHDVFKGFRVDEGFYTTFCGRLLVRLFELLPKVDRVEIDGFPAVQREGPLVKELVRLVEGAGKRLDYGPERGWGEGKAADYEISEAEAGRMRKIITGMSRVSVID